MRNVSPKALTREQMQAKSQDLDRAWKTLVAAAPKGSAALKDELGKLDASGGKDDFFRPGAAGLVPFAPGTACPASRLSPSKDGQPARQ
jgi:hypothetical protein